MDTWETPVTHAAYLDGLIDGLSAYAWWKDGVQYVGTCGTTLAEAIEKAKRGELVI